MSAIAIPCPACGQHLKIRDRSLLGRRAKCPKCAHSFVLEEPEEVELHLAGSSAVVGAATPARPAATSPTAAPLVPSAAQPDLGFPVAAPAGLATASRLKTRRKSGKKKWGSLVVAAGVVLLAAGSGYLFYTIQQQQPAPVPVATQPTQRGIGSGGSQASVIPEGITTSPTKGAPVSLAMVPAGARTIVHFRPAELWAAGSRGEEFRYCLGPLGVYIDQQLTAICKRPPAEIESVLFAWIPGQRGTPPDWSVVVRLNKEIKKSELLDIMGGVPDDSYGHPVYIGEERAGVIKDLKTYALAPASMAEDLVLSISGQSPMPIGIESLVELSDSQRHLSIFFEPTAMLLDMEFMVPAAAQPFMKQFMDWFGNDVETALWSLHLEPDRFFSDLQIRNMTTAGTRAMEETFREQLGVLPTQLVAAVRMMQPSVQGQRTVIGRFPAMMKAFSMATITEHTPRTVRFITSLPDRAAPNLALGALLAWDESTRTDFTREMPSATPSGQPSNLPDKLADRLKQKIDVDFRRTPLQEAFAYIADETKVQIDIDGDALKLAGYTQNMPQSFKLDQTTGIQALAEIIKQYDKMCIIVDEEQKLATVMTFQVAEQKGLKPFPLKP